MTTGLLIAILVLMCIGTAIQALTFSACAGVDMNTKPKKLWRPTGEEPANNKTVVTKPKNYVLEAVQFYCKANSRRGIVMRCSLNAGNGDITIEAEAGTYEHRGMKRTQVLTGMLVEDLNCQGQPAATDMAYCSVDVAREQLLIDMDVRDSKLRKLEVPWPTLAEDAKSKLPKKARHCPRCNYTEY